MNAYVVWALLALAVLVVTVGVPLLMAKTFRSDDARQAVLDGNDVHVIGEGKHARFALQTPDGDRYEQTSPGGIWSLAATKQAQAVATLDEEAA